MRTMGQGPCGHVLFSFYSGVSMTKGDILRYATAFALIPARKVVRGLKQELITLCRNSRRMETLGT
jgi:hypothetical protein